MTTPKDVGERKFPEPEDKQVDDRRRPGVARAVKRLRQSPCLGVEKKSAGNDRADNQRHRARPSDRV